MQLELNLEEKKEKSTKLIKSKSGKSNPPKSRRKKKMRFSGKAYNDYDAMGRDFTVKALEAAGILKFNKETHVSGSLAYVEVKDSKKSKAEREQDRINKKIDRPDFLLTTDGKTALCGLEATVKVGWEDVSDFWANNKKVCSYYSRRIKYMQHSFPVGIVNWSVNGSLSFHVWMDNTDPAKGHWNETSRNPGKEEYFPSFMSSQASLDWKSQEYLMNLPVKQEYDKTWTGLMFLLR